MVLIAVTMTMMMTMMVMVVLGYWWEREEKMNWKREGWERGWKESMWWWRIVPFFQIFTTFTPTWPWQLCNHAQQIIKKIIFVWVKKKYMWLSAIVTFFLSSFVGTLYRDMTVIMFILVKNLPGLYLNPY